MGAFQGKMGSMTTYQAPAGNIARVRNNATNVGADASRTELQQANRVRWANLVNLYKASGDWMLKAFEGKLRKHSDYNVFMSTNFTASTIALTKEEAASGACVVAGYVVSKGSIPSIQVHPYEDIYVTDLRIGELEPDEDTTVAELSAALVTYNSHIKAGMQLSFVSYQQTIDEYGVPRVICTPYEMRINPNDTAHKAFDYLPAFCLSFGSGYITTSDAISSGAFAYVLSDTRGGRVRVSTQRLITRNADLLALYSSVEQIRKAMLSYGLSADQFLDTQVAIAKQATPQPNAISAIVFGNGETIRPGMHYVTLKDFFGYSDPNLAKIFFLNPIDASSECTVSISLDNGVSIATNVRGKSDKEVRITMYSSDAQYLDRSIDTVTFVQGESVVSLVLRNPEGYLK